MRNSLSGAKVLALESKCKGAYDLIPTARRFAHELRRLHGYGYDVRQHHHLAAVVRDDRPIIPKASSRWSTTNWLSHIQRIDCDRIVQRPAIEFSPGPPGPSTTRRIHRTHQNTQNAATASMSTNECI